MKIVNDNLLYAKCAQYIKNRKELTEDKLEGLEEIVMDEGKVQAIFAASKSSMGNLWLSYYINAGHGTYELIQTILNDHNHFFVGIKNVAVMVDTSLKELF